MNVNGIGSTTVGSLQNVERTQETKAAKTSEKEADKTQTERVDQFVEGDSSASVVYSRSESKRITSDQLLELQRQRADSFTQMLRSMVTRQGQKSNLVLFGMDLTASSDQVSAAKSAIGPGGEYSAEAVSGRILDMAKALAGDDATKIDGLRAAVEKGFQAAGVELGGKLPSLCNDTYDLVMKGFDDWKKSFSQSEETE